MTCVFFSVQFSLLINTTYITIKILTSQCNHANKTHKHILRHDSQLPSNMFQVVFASIITILHDEREREREREQLAALAARSVRCPYLRHHDRRLEPRLWCTQLWEAGPQHRGFLAIQGDANGPWVLWLRCAWDRADSIWLDLLDN